MDFRTKQLAHFAIRRTKQPTTCSLLVSSAARSGFGYYVARDCNSLHRTLMQYVLGDWWHRARMEVPHQYRRGFNSMVLLVAWGL